jgi:glycosyltransferase involved in cell wall biosynthesis
MPRVSAILPSRNERFLVPTVNDLLTKAGGDVEIVVVCDGYWEHDLPADPRVKVLHFGRAQGMRPAINAATQIATGEYFLKADAHTLWDEGWDLKLLADYREDNWVLTCRRYALEPESWTLDTSNAKYPIDYHYLSYPYTGEATAGLHGTAWTARREEHKAIELDEEMSSQGSGYFLSRKQWNRIGPLDIASYGNFVHEFQEVGLKTWLGGGAVMVTKRTFYAHLYKGKRYGRGYVLGPEGHKQGTEFCTKFWMGDQWAQRVRDLRWLVERFNPPGWPADLDAAFRRAA